ncbi:MAG: hypothetical protein F6K23_12890 [Okeania sp. SIO2C9]|uniref:calcium-binding protein n=1 Tax=Okeania sp. SIO2C9 TaxID=2607791 RepID=UPI0013C0F439|nr:calcium-binding protein [Okeania sp. SIO2C9]NEQ73867.1 hypothetical protein [Okeania sp. SIO2C9]
MPKSNQSQNKNKSQPDTRKLKPIEIDETIISGKTGKLNNGENITISVPIEDFLQHIGAFQGMEVEDEAEQINLEVFEQKLEEIFNTSNLKVNQSNLKKYFKYLKQNIDFPCLVTGIEEFEWEEHYTIGPGSKKEYQKLKKKKPSYTDVFNLLKLDDKLDLESGILAELERTTDSQKFILPLAELEAVMEDSENAELLEDYSMWFFTYL